MPSEQVSDGILFGSSKDDVVLHLAASSLITCVLGWGGEPRLNALKVAEVLNHLHGGQDEGFVVEGIAGCR